jgi:hypothetical protein
MPAADCRRWPHAATRRRDAYPRELVESRFKWVSPWIWRARCPRFVRRKPRWNPTWEPSEAERPSVDLESVPLPDLPDPSLIF